MASLRKSILTYSQRVNRQLQIPGIGYSRCSPIRQRRMGVFLHILHLLATGYCYANALLTV